MKALAESIEFGPQPGPQESFLASQADIVFYGGAAGGGKTYSILLEPLRHYHNPQFGCVIFRRNTTQVRNEGGLWHESTKIYKPLGAHPREAFLDWQFPSGMRVKFSHLEHESTVYDWQGAQIALIEFDEITHFTETQFFYMLSRNRSTSGVRSYCRATCNPDADSWVRKFIDWWIDDDGWAIPEHAGVIRWFIRVDERIIWGDSREELVDVYGGDTQPKSFTFIPSKITDNKVLMEADPGYLASLKSLAKVERQRLLGDHEKGGNWNIRHTAGNIFDRNWFEIIDAVPPGFIDVVRFWDRAATKPVEGSSKEIGRGSKKKKASDPDWTRGLKMYRYPDNTYVVGDLRSMRDTPYKVMSLIQNTASHDGRRVRIVSQQDPGSAGVQEKDHFIKSLSGYVAETMLLTNDKVTRAKPVSAQSEVGAVRILRGPWNEEFFEELEGFPDATHDDIVDAYSGAFNALFATKPTIGSYV